MTPKEMLPYATQFTLHIHENGYMDVIVEKRGENTWVVKDGGEVLDKENKWQYEPFPSNRTDKFIAETRFTLEEAFKLAFALGRKE